MNSRQMFPISLIGSSFTSRQTLVVIGVAAIGISSACCVWEGFSRYILLGGVGAIGLVLAFVFFVSKLRWGVTLLILEAILGGNGHWFNFPGTTITPRYILLPLVLLGYIATKMLARKSRFPRIILGPPMLIFGVLMVGSVIHAVLNGNPEPFQEAQVWLYLLLYPIIVDLWFRRGIPIALLQTVVWATVAMAIFQLVLMLTINLNSNVFAFIYENSPLDAMRITMPRMQGTELRYVFWGNSSLCGVVLAVVLLIIGARQMKIEIMSRSAAWKILILMCLAMVCSMTRGTWGQLALTIMLVGLDFVMRQKIPWRLVLMAIVVILGIVWAFSALPSVRGAFELRLSTLLADRSTLDDDDSLVIKKVERNQLYAAIAANPVFGYGFGLGNYGDYGDKLVEDNRIRFHNYFLGFALKTGVVGLAGLLFLLFIGCLWAMHVGNMVRHGFSEQRALLCGMSYGFAGVFLATTSNPHLGTPAVILAFAVMMAVSDLGFEEWVKHQSVIHNESGKL